MTKQEKAVEEVEVDADEEADTFDAEAVGTPGGGTQSVRTTKAQRERTANSLSLISKKYDLDGDGKLDATEQMMLEYDKNHDGELSMREIHQIVSDLRAQQAELDHERKTILNMRRVIIGLVVFTFILALAMLGVSFAAATLAKDTKTDPSTSNLADKRTGETLGTVGTSRGSGYEMFLNRTRRERNNDTEPTGNETDVRGRRRLQRSPLAPPAQLLVGRKRRSLQWFGGRVGDDDNNGDDDDDDLENFMFDDDDVDLGDCKEYRGKIDSYYDYERGILRAFRNNERSHSFWVEDDDWERKETIDIEDGWRSKDSEQLIISGGGRCSSRYETYHIFDCDKANVNDCDPDEECCSRNCCDYFICELER